MHKNTSAFTFVELIVVLVIISILSTVGFSVYESYLGTGRDTVRTTKLKDINTSLSTFAARGRIPVPEGSTQVNSSGSTLFYQGDFDVSIAKTVGFSDDVYDEDLNIYPTIAIAPNKKDFQVLMFFEDPVIKEAALLQTYANTDYENLYVKGVGKQIGILLNADTQEPLNKNVTYSGDIYDITAENDDILIFFSDNKRIYSENGNKILDVIPNRSCKRILEIGKSIGSGEYVISPDGITKFKTYCDMNIDGGGWTFVAYIDARNTSTNLFSSNIGTFMSDRSDSDALDQDTSYSIDSTTFNHTEMMITLDDKDPIISNKNDKIVFFEYAVGNNFFYSGPTPCVIGEYPKYKTQLSGDLKITNSRYCNSNTWGLRDTTRPDEANIVSHQTPYGTRWWEGMGGDNTGNHPTWIYVR